MSNLKYCWRVDGSDHSIVMAYVESTNGHPFLFGEGQERRAIEIQGFFMATVPVTQALWTHVMGVGTNPSHFRGDRRPVENVSWHDVTGSDGFLRRINASDIVAEMAHGAGRAGASFRLPSETEWEYAARGGPRWAEGFQFSGSNDAEAVAWYDRNSGGPREPGFWERRPRSNHLLGTETHDVALKTSNQIGIYDMSGNVWEWCQDCFTRNTSNIPTDGSPFVGNSSERILRGGCHHNWAIHCTVSKRYKIVAEHRDECVGFRLALSSK